MTFLPDTSCLVPLIAMWHPHRDQTAREIEGRLDRGETMVLAGPSLAETYSVLTRVPAGRRVAPATARTALEALALQASEIVTLDAAAYVELLRRASAQGIAGGRVYDAVIATCAAQAGVGTLLTFNVAHFSTLVAPGIEVLSPGP